MKRMEQIFGFTSLEMLVAITLSFILISVIYSAYHFSLRYPRIWNDKMKLENNALLCMRQMSLDILECDWIEYNHNQEIYLSSEVSEMITYRIENERLLRNDKGFNDDPVRLVDFQLRPVESKPDIESLLQFTNEVKQTPHETWIIEMTFKNRSSRLTLSNAISPRRQNPMRNVVAQRQGEF